MAGLAKYAKQNPLAGDRVPELESIRQWRQRWKAEIERRLGVRGDGSVIEPSGLIEWMRQHEARPTPYHSLVRLPSGEQKWRMTFLMRPSEELDVLIPGRLEGHVGDRAWRMVLESWDAMREISDRFGRALFRARLAPFRFPSDSVDRAVDAALAGAHVQVSTTANRVGAALLVDGFVMGVEQLLPRPFVSASDVPEVSSVVDVRA